MNIKFKIAGLAAAAALAATAAWADEDAELSVEGQDLITKLEAGEDHPLPEILSGWRFRASETQAIQTDDFDNPAMIFVDQAQDAYQLPDGAAGKACADCHGDVESFKGVKTVMPKINGAGVLWSMEDYINDCRTSRMEAEAWKWDKEPMNSMVALIGLQSRGMPMNVKADGPYEIYFEQGKEMYYTRYGQLELSCANCHEENYGNMIRADHLSQGQINGFPTYRLKNTKLNSVHGRFKGCIRDTRAETFSPGSDEFRALELYVAWRGNGLSVETPSVRN